MINWLEIKIPEIINKKWNNPIIHIASEIEYWDKLKAKLKEEVEEYFKEENTDELADIIEVIDAIKEFKKINNNELSVIKGKKYFERGGFEDRIILDEVRDE